MKGIHIDVDKKEIKELIEELESGKYFLPSFQRQYIWDEDNIKDLIDSIINNYPIGTIILWKPSNPSIAKSNPFSKPLIDVDSKNITEIFYVIDGQQRLTSLLLLFKDWEISRGGEKIKCEVPISYNPSNGKLYKSWKKGINLSELIKAFGLKDKDALRRLMDTTPSEQFDDMNEKINRILGYKVPIYVMKTFEENEETFQKIFRKMAEAFIRINKYGVRIGNLELMLSFLAGILIGDIKERIYMLYESLYQLFKIDLQPVIRFAFSNFGLKQTQISNVNQFKANIERIKEVSESERINIFEKCKTSMELAIDILKEELGIPDSRLLPSQIPLITVASYLYYNNIQKLSDLNNRDIEKIINWYILTSFNGYYSSATDTKLDEDLNIVKTLDSFPYEQLIENMRKRKAKIKISKQDIERGLKINVLRKEGRAHLFLLYILLVKKDADNWNGRRLRETPLDELARHHIFPKEYLEKELNIDDPNDREVLINNLGNITFISKSINSEIGDKPPTDPEYLERYIKYIDKHFIPQDRNLWKLEQYQTFLDYRITEIYSEGKKVFNKIFE